MRLGKQMENKRLLVISRAPWIDDNSTGATLTEFFSDFAKFDIYGLCLREAPVVTSICKKNFYISEGQIVKSLFHKTSVGKLTEDKDVNTKHQQREYVVYKRAKKLNLTIFQFFREALWGTGIWKNDNLNNYLTEVNPDVIFFPDFPCVYAHKVLKYVKNKTNAKVAIFHADDCYTLKQFSISPLYWLFRFYQRKWVKSSVNLADLHYVISDVQKKDYDRAFHVNNKLLTKFGNFNGKPSLKSEFNKPLQIVYTGNIGLNRWKSLAIIVDALKVINKDEVRAELIIYTASEITKPIKKALDIPHCSRIMGKVPASEIPAIQNAADILVHVEAFDLKNRLTVRQSFSTKIVDYFKRGRAILAVGPSEVASIKHLIDNDCAIVVDSCNDLAEKLNVVIEDNEQLNEYAEKAYECGKRLHNRKDMLKMLYDDLNCLVGK